LEKGRGEDLKFLEKGCDARWVSDERMLIRVDLNISVITVLSPSYVQRCS